MKIKIDELQNTITLLLSKIKEEKGNEIDLENDFYWDIPDKEMYYPYEKPSDMSLGQLSDNLQEINRLAKNKDEAIPYDLKRIASVLRALSAEHPVMF